jgi:hypothetical protein
VSGDAIVLSSRLVTEACDKLAKAVTLDEVKDVRDRGKALQAYAKQKKSGAEAHWLAYEIIQRATRRFGEVSREMPNAKPGRKPAAEIVFGTGNDIVVPKTQRLKEAGVSYKEAMQAERIAALPEDAFEANLAAEKERILKRASTGSGIASTSAAAGYDSDDYGTPEPILEAGRELLGGDFDLDPCSNAEAQKLVRAKTFWTKEDDCLKQKIWKAKRLWMNPPYSRVIGSIITELLRQIDAGHVASGLVLVNNQTDASWFQSMMKRYPTWFNASRVYFIVGGEPLKDTRQGQALFYIGPKLPAFRRIYEKRLGGLVMVH